MTGLEFFSPFHCRVKRFLKLSHDVFVKLNRFNRSLHSDFLLDYCCKRIEAKTVIAETASASGGGRGRTKSILL